MRRGLAATTILALSLASPPSDGNGRAPRTTSIHLVPGDPHSIYVGATFGLLVSHDEGCTFRWVCEGAVGYGGIFDPSYAVAADGAIFATTYAGLRVSRDGGCSFATVTAPVYFSAIDIGPTGDIWIATADITVPGAISRSTDNGAAFEPRGMLSPAIQWNGLRVAPTDPDRIYATGTESSTQTHLFTTRDGGATWTASALSAVIFGGLPSVRVIAVDPRNADIVYVASELGANPPNGDRLYRSTDGGATLTEVLATTAAIRDLAFPDATHVIVADQVGGFRSNDGGRTFTALDNAPQLQCIAARTDGTLIGCGTNWTPDSMSLATSMDAAASWTKLWVFSELDGPLACPAGSPEHDICDAQQWSILEQQFGVTGPVCGANTWPSEAPPHTSSRGCCDASGGPALSIGWAGLVAAWLGRRRPRQATVR